MIVDRIRLLQRQRAKQSMLHFRIGDIVNFKTNEGEEITGVLVRMNKKSVTVHAENGHRWNVAPHMLTKAQDQLGCLSRDELQHEAHIHHIEDKKVHYSATIQMFIGLLGRRAWGSTRENVARGGYRGHSAPRSRSN